MTTLWISAALQKSSHVFFSSPKQRKSSFSVSSVPRPFNLHSPFDTICSHKQSRPVIECGPKSSLVNKVTAAGNKNQGTVNLSPQLSPSPSAYRLHRRLYHKRHRYRLYHCHSETCWWRKGSCHNRYQMDHHRCCIGLGWNGGDSYPVKKGNQEISQKAQCKQWNLVTIKGAVKSMRYLQRRSIEGNGTKVIYPVLTCIRLLLAV